MTQLMEMKLFDAERSPARLAVLAMLRPLSRALTALVAQLEATPARKKPAVAEFSTIELNGCLVGAYYLDGELMAVVPDLVRL
jgi:hypothetical protein